jgi:hypothetical protein
MAGADQRQRLALRIADQPLGERPAGKGVLHDREGDQHDDQDEAAGERRLHDRMVDAAGNGEIGGGDPEDEHQPGRDQHDRPVVSPQRKVKDDGKPDRRGDSERHPRHAGGDARVYGDDAAEHREAEQPEDCHMAVADMPSMQVQIGVQKNDQGAGQHHLRSGAPRIDVAAGGLEQPAPEAEIDGDIGKHRPGQRGGGREHGGALDDEENAQEEGQQAGDPQHHAAVERVAVDHVLEGLRLPKQQFRQPGVAKLGHVGDDGARVERNAEDVVLAARQPHRSEAFAGRNRADAL